MLRGMKVNDFVRRCGRRLRLSLFGSKRFRKDLLGLVLVCVLLLAGLVLHYSTDKPAFHRSATTRPSCHVAVISTFPPRKCGIAEFTRSLVDAMQQQDVFAATCDITILALVEPKQARAEEHLRNRDPRVVPLIVDSHAPSRSFWNASEYLNHGGFTHVILQHEFWLTPNRWQLVDVARWLRPNITLISVIHTPLDDPTVQEAGILRQLARFSKWVVVMNWHGLHLFRHAFGIDPAKILFIPIGVTLPPPSYMNQNSLRKQPGSMPNSKNRAIETDAVHFNYTEPALLDLDDSHLLILANGLLQVHKGFRRLVRVLPAIVKVHPTVRFYMVGESPTGVSGMNSLLQKAAALGVGRHVKWINKYTTDAQLAEYFRRCDLYVTLFNQLSSTSATLSTAMAHGLAIISTPYRFAIETLANDRGLIVPFEDDAATTNAVITMLDDPSLRAAYGRRASEFVHQWQWPNVAAHYVHLILGSTATSRYSSQLTDPLAGEPQLELLKKPARWSQGGIRTFDEREFQLKAGDKVSGVYVLYVDHCLQINAKIETNLLFSVVAIGTQTEWINAHWQHGVDNETISRSPLHATHNGLEDDEVMDTADNDKDTIDEREESEKSDDGTVKDDLGVFTCNEDVKVDFAQGSVVIASENVHVEVKVDAKQGVSLTFLAASRFAAPRGLLGDTLRCRHDRSVAFHCQDVLGWTNWVVASGLLFSHDVEQQSWSQFGISLNVFAAASRPLPRSMFENHEQG